MSDILRQLPGNWLECRDEQGIFYFNQVTQQSSETVPAELMGGPPGPAAAPSQAPSYGGAMTPQQQPPWAWGQQGMPPQGAMSGPPMQAQQQMYLPQQMPQSQQMFPPQQMPQGQQQMPQMYPPQQPPQQQMPQQQMPPQQMPQQQLLQQQAAQQQMLQQQMLQQQQQMMMSQQMSNYGGQPQPQFAQPQGVQTAPQLQGVPSYTPAMQAQPQPQMMQPQGLPVPAVQKMAFGDWGVYQDEMGMFYLQVSTGVQFENPPPELMQAYQLYRAEQDQQHMQQLQQIEQQKAAIDQQLAQQTNALQMTMNYGQAVQ